MTLIFIKVIKVNKFIKFIDLYETLIFILYLISQEPLRN